MWFDGWDAVIGDSFPQLTLGKGERVEVGFPAFQPVVSKSARCLRTVSAMAGSRIAAPSDRELRREWRQAPSRRSMSSSDNASRSTDSAAGEPRRRQKRGPGRKLGCGGPCGRRNERRDLADGARAHQTGRWQSHTDGRFERVFDFDAHQRIQSKIRQRLVVAQTVRFDPQDGADDSRTACGDDRSAIFRRGGFDLEPPVARHAAAFLTFDGSTQNALEQRILLHAAEELPPLRPIHADRRDLRVAGEQGKIRAATSTSPGASSASCLAARGIRRRVRCARRNLRRRARPSSSSARAGRARAGDGRASRGRHWPRRNSPAPDSQRCWRWTRT